MSVESDYTIHILLMIKEIHSLAYTNVSVCVCNDPTAEVQHHLAPNQTHLQLLSSKIDIISLRSCK